MEKRVGLKYRVSISRIGLLLFIAMVASYDSAAMDVNSVRLGVHSDKTRFVMEMSEKPKYNIFFLSNPYRIVIDMQEVHWKASALGGKGKGIIQDYRYGLFRKGTSRVVLDLKAPVKILRKVILPPSEGKPYRFFIDVQRTTNKIFADSVKSSRRKIVANAPSVIHTIPDTNNNRKIRVVIDAGHGGIDPGATGKSGVYEKKLTLAVALKLHARLNRNPRFKAILTRADDTFLSLRERVNVARRNKSDLFISIHADSIGRSDVRGSTVYTLSENASDDEAAALAKDNNKSDVIAGVDLEAQDDTVQSILIDLAQRETMNFSVKFAKLLIPEIAHSGMKVGGKSHRFAGFRVLKAPDVPSVLVELGYLSNHQDEKILKSSSGQMRLANSIADAVEKYFKLVAP